MGSELLGASVQEQQGFEASGWPVISLERQNSTLFARVHWRGTRERMAYYGFSYGKATTLALELCALWIATGLGVWLTGWTVRRRTAKRLTRGSCVQCGYDLKGLCVVDTS